MDDYYVISFAYIIFIPVILLAAILLFINGIIDAVLGVRIAVVFADTVAVIFIALCFMAMFLYGYRSARKYRNPEKKPEFYFPLSELYIPLLIPAVWYLLWTAVMNIFDVHIIDDLLGGLILLFVVVNPYAAIVYNHDLPPIFSLDTSHSLLIYNLMYYFILILGFTAGERLYAHRAKNKSDDTNMFFIKPKKGIIIFFTFVLAVYSLSEIVLYHHRKNIVPEARPAKSYGFAYEGGYSSTDLEPYYVENESNILAKLNEPSTFTIYNPLDMPILDGAEAVYPVYSAFGNACYYNIAEIQEYGKEQRRQESIPEEYIVMPIRFSNTIRAYEKLLSGEVDICFGARPSEEQLKMAEEQGKEVVLTPIGKEGFVFFVNDANPVDSLTWEQLKGIYSGKIKNWSKVGGTNDKILAFQRPENSGSQTMMEYFMGDTPLKDPLEAEYYQSMGGVLKDVAAYDNGTASIAYSFRYFAMIMTEESSGDDSRLSNAGTQGGIKFLAVDGVYPTEETIRSGEYPLTTELYAITVNDPNRPDNIYYKDTIEPFVEWMTGPQGQKIVKGTGYVSLE